MKTESVRRQGFTLIELLPLLMVIGIQAAVLFPGIQGVTRSAKKNTALNKVRSIGQGYMNWAQGGKVMTRIGTWTPAGKVATKTSEYAANLAAGAGLDSGELWFVDGDVMLESNAPTMIMPKNVVLGSGSSAEIDPLFTDSIREATGTSWTVYADTSSGVVGSVSVPLAWTRGLHASGLWAVADGTVNGSVWGSEGGHIVYGDGHVSWTSSTSVDGDNFFTNKAGQPTANWKQSRGVPANAQALPQQ
jgi:type II secretory pathway pseudopilin PulG